MLVAPEPAIYAQTTYGTPIVIKSYVYNTHGEQEFALLQCGGCVKVEDIVYGEIEEYRGINWVNDYE